MVDSELEERLLEFDGSAISILTEAQVACASQPDYLNDVTQLCFDPRATVSAGASWILNAEIESGAALPRETIERVVNSLDKIDAWQAALHLCQAVDWFDLTRGQAGRFGTWAAQYADHARPFLRAWSLHVRVVLGARFHEYREDAAVALGLMENDPAASVKARARQLRKKHAL